MKWIRLESGIPPQSDMILIYKEDNTYDVAFRVENKYLGSDGEDVLSGPRIRYFIDLPELKNKIALKPELY